MNRDLKTGDEVMLSSNSPHLYGGGSTDMNPLNMLGVVIGSTLENWIKVRWENGETNYYEDIDSDLILQKNKNKKQMSTTTTKTGYQTNFKNNFSTLLGACRIVAKTFKNQVTTLELKKALWIKYPNTFIDQNMVSKACEQLFNEGVFTGFKDSGTYRVYYLSATALNKATQVFKATKAPAQKVGYQNINEAITAHPELATILADYLHKSDTKNEYMLLKDMNIVHLNNKIKLEMANWNTKTPLNKFQGCNKYCIELNRRESCN